MSLLKLNVRFYSVLKRSDPVLQKLILKEAKLRHESVDFVSSNSICCKSILEAAGSSLQGSYSGWFHDEAYYGGSYFLKEIEDLTRKRALKLFNLDSNAWSVNVQPYSGSLANLAAFLSVLDKGDRIMGLSCNHGGHHTHCVASENSKSSFLSSEIFNTKPFYLDKNTELLDYDSLLLSVENFQPHLLVIGSASYSRLFDYEKIYKICKPNNILLHADIAHVSGLIAAKIIPSPFPYADIVTTTTHKTLRSTRGGLIFFRKNLQTKNGEIHDMEHRVNNTVNCRIQGCPHCNIIASTSVALELATTDKFAKYQAKVVENALHMSNLMKNLNYRIVSGICNILTRRD